MKRLLVFAIFMIPNPGHSQQKDWRDICLGLIIPDETYSDQPYVIKTDDGAWLCILTTSSGIEGSSGQYVAITRSLDRGKSWSNLLPLEPIDGPEASYAVLLKVPTGRIYAFYNHNTDNVREIKTELGSTVKRVDSQGYFVFRYSDDHGITWSEKRYTIPVRAFEIDRNNVYEGAIRFFWNVGKAFSHNGAGYVPLIKVGGFGEGFFTSNEGVLLKSPNILTEKAPEKIVWETLPDGDIGLRAPAGGGPIAAEQSYSVLSDGSFFVVYRTIDGHPAYSYSRDGGHTWDPPQYMRFANGHLVKNPRAANFAWRCENGKFIYWFHNHGGRFIRENPARRTMGYLDRNPAWISGGVERDSPAGKVIAWSQPEILLYDDDPIIRMSYPDLVEENGKYFVTETQKDVARIHPIDNALLTGIWDQFENEKKSTEGLVRELKWDKGTFPILIDSVSLKPFYVRDNDRQDHGGKKILSGFTIEMAFSLTQINSHHILFDTRNESGKGILLEVTDSNVINLALSDGKTISSWSCDAGMLQKNKEHFMSIIVDGGPKMIMFVVDGTLNDGGDTRQFGWGRFSPYLQDVNGGSKWTVGKQIRGNINRLNFHSRAIRVSEAVGNFRYYTRQKTNK